MDLEKENNPFIGADTVKKIYEKQAYETVSLSFVSRVLKKLSLTKNRVKK
ncbi:MAG: hypothetical protein LRZ92_02325 [Methanosarcinaceae archaeon]|nr:hypothetical protein [Methanosarcinaceae archaeon]